MFDPTPQAALANGPVGHFLKLEEIENGGLDVLQPEKPCGIGAR